MTAADPSPEELLRAASQLSLHVKDERGEEPISKLYASSRASDQARQAALERHMLDSAPQYLSLHASLHDSTQLLEQLESFLTTFHTDLESLSSQMTHLQGRSLSLATRLANRRALETRLNRVLAGITLEPHIVELLLADDQEAAGKAIASTSKLDLNGWNDLVARLDVCLRACSEAGVLLAEAKQSVGTPGTGTGINGESSPLLDANVKSLEEAREVAEGCKLMAAGRLRPLLTSSFAPLRNSLTTNLPVLQSVLLRSHRPLFRFLSQHTPRVAIDVQRAYVASARLYFETGFRRYARSLAAVRDREKRGAGAEGTIVDVGRSAISSLLSNPLGTMNSLTNQPGNANQDPWLVEPSRLEHAKLSDGPAVVLAYLADDATYKAPLEALFRSLSLAFLDNASSEYAFLARFFESVDLVGGGADAVGSSAVGSATASGSGRGTRAKAAAKESLNALSSTGPEEDQDDDNEGPLPEDSASAAGDLGQEDENDGDGRTEIGQEGGNVVSLSEVEKRRLRGRGAIDGLWKQIMEPVIGTYNSFTQSILAAGPSLLPLLTMVKLNDAMEAAALSRGCSSVLLPVIISFKMQAWPAVQRQFDECIQGVKKLADGAASSSASSGGLASLWGGGGSNANTAANGESPEKAAVIKMIATRYAKLFSSIVKLCADEEDAMLFASLLRLRTEVENLIKAHADRITERPRRLTFDIECHEAILRALESGPASISVAKVQAETSHWREELDKRKRS